MSFLIRCCLACLLISPLAAQGFHSPRERYQMFQEYLARRASEITRNNLANIRTAADWERRRPEVRRQVLYMLGLDRLPARTPLHARITNRFDRPGYHVENILFESMPGLYVTGNLYVPAALERRAPAVVYVCGHSPSPAGAKVIYQHNGIRLAGLGYVVLMIDPIHFGELPGIHHGTSNLEMWDWLSLGYTPVGPEVWNVMRALDYLETRPEVDPKRFAIMGGSGGGSVSWYAPAADERIRVSIPRVATWTAENQIAEDAVKENCDCIYFPNTFQLDLPAVGALIAPRSLDIHSARRDPMFPQAGYRDAGQRCRRIYDLTGAGEHIAELDQDVPHSDTPEFRRHAYGWLNRWLKDDLTPYQEREVKLETPETLTVLDHRPANAINDAIHKTFIPAHVPQKWSSLEAWKKRRAGLLAELKDKTFRAFPRAKADFAVSKRPADEWTTRYAEASDVEFTTEEGVRVTGQLYVPRGPARSWPALIEVKGEADNVYPVDYDFILPALADHVVLVLRPRAVDYPIDNWRRAILKRSAALVGATIESMQIWDILRSVDFLVDQQKLGLDGITVHGRKEIGVLGLYAAALDERITRVVVDHPPASHWDGPALLNVLRITDLPEAAALVAPREVVSLGVLPAEYDYTRSVFALYGAKTKIRRANGLFEALPHP